MRKLLILIVLGVVAGCTGWYYYVFLDAPEEFALYGNVEFKQAELAFNASQRVAEILVDEGDRVVAGQVLARLDQSSIRPQVAQAEAQVAYNRSVVDELESGSRPEEIAQADANLRAAQTEADNLKQQYDRHVQLLRSQTVSQQALDQAKAAAEIAAAKVEVSRKAFDLVRAGPRQERIAQAQAQLEASQAQLAALRQQLADSELKAPADGLVRSRLMEPGEIATPARTVVSLALPDPKWVRTYVSETGLGLLKPGVAAVVTVDSFPGRTFDGRIGFISPAAEFTPKTVQTQDLRTSLVYEVRVVLDDPDDMLRLGMPATVRLRQEPASAEAGK